LQALLSKQALWLYVVFLENKVNKKQNSMFTDGLLLKWRSLADENLRIWFSPILMGTLK